MSERPLPARRLVATVAVAATVVAGAVFSTSAGAREGDLPGDYDRQARAQTARALQRDAEQRPHRHAPADGHGHDHSDPSTQNAISRSGETGE